MLSFFPLDQGKKCMRYTDVEIDLTRYTKKGVAYGIQGSKKIEVRGGLVGETVAATIVQKKKGSLLAQLDMVKSPSEQRRAAKCAHFPECGGCTFQNLKYSSQLAYKQNVIEELFGESLPIVPCEQEWNYRNKMEYTFSEDKEGKKYLGLIKAGSKGRVITLSECFLTSHWFMEAAHVTKEWWETHCLSAFHPFKDTGHLRNLIVREAKNTGERMIILVVSGNPEYALSKTALDDFVQRMRAAFEEQPLHIFLKIQQCIPGKPTQFFEIHLHGNEWLTEKLIVSEKETYIVKISPSAFYQPNSVQIGTLYAKAIELAEPQKTDIVYDLYCGIGTIGIAFSKYVKEVKGIELNPYAVYDAHANIEANEIDNMEVIRGDVGEQLQGMKAPDIAIIDPPRSGLEKNAMRNLLALGAKKIIYISCNPYTQAEDTTQLMAHGYTMKGVQPVDQFPQTAHCENIVVLQLEEK